MKLDVRRVGAAAGTADAVAAVVAGGVRVAALLAVAEVVAEEADLAATLDVAAAAGGGGCGPVGGAAREARVLAGEAAGLHDLVLRKGCVLHNLVSAVAENGGCSGYFHPDAALGLVPWLPTPLCRVGSTHHHDQCGGRGHARTN